MPAPPWQYVVLAMVASGFFLGVFALVPDDQPEMRTALLGLLTLAGQAAVARWIVGHHKSEVDAAMRKAQRMMNRRQHDVSRETSADVSRETRRPKGRGTP
jgi:hypothetical protein